MLSLQRRAIFVFRNNALFASLTVHFCFDCKKVGSADHASEAAVYLSSGNCARFGAVHISVYQGSSSSNFFISKSPSKSSVRDAMAARQPASTAIQSQQACQQARQSSFFRVVYILTYFTYCRVPFPQYHRRVLRD